MSSVQEQKSSAILDEMRILGEIEGNQGARKVLNSELWHACAGPLVSLPQPGSLVYYFPQGHSEQVSASTRKISNSHIPNYPALASQLLCQVHNVTLHADRDTDEIYAQMTLQPVNSEGDVFPIPNFGHTISKQPNEFFCKNLTASDTSTHGGFSVPRRAADKLFPQLDYTMQPPSQELIVKDLHENIWTFRHIYRGQPKRHLLTTGWSLFVGTKRLKAGDSVLFIRDEKSQLLLGVRRANRQQTALPSSVLSTDSMHIGVLAAAAHAAASRSPFTIYYNPRACPSEFIIPLAKYHKAVYTQVSVGMRFGMMFETEETTKRRYMGTIVGISDFDPLRWPNSKWRNLQVEWDEQGYGERPDRVSLWEIETPESLFVFPTPSLKRQCLPGFVVPGTEIGFGNVKTLPQALESGSRFMHPIMPEFGSDQLLKMLLTPQIPIPDNHLRCNQSICASVLQKIGGNGFSPTVGSIQSPIMLQTLPSQNIPSQAQKSKCSASEINIDKAETQFEKSSDCDSSALRELTEKSNIAPEAVTKKVVVSNHENIVSPTIQDQEPQLNEQKIPQLRSSSSTSASSLDKNNIISSQSFDHDSLHQSFTDADSQFLFSSNFAPSPSADISSIVNSQTLNPFEPFQFSCIQEFFSGDEINTVHEEEETDLQKITNSCQMRDSYDKSETYCNIHFEASNENMITSSCVLSKERDLSLFVPSEDLFSLQSQVTSTNVEDSQLLTLQDIPEGSGGTSSGSMDVTECGFLNKCSMKQATLQRLRTYTKVQKLGSVGRSIDVTRFKDYHELKSAIACMFGLEGQLDDSRSSEGKLVYVDYENDVLLVGDDPWEEFVKCVRCIRILSPTEVQQMSEEGIQLMNSYLSPCS